MESITLQNLIEKSQTEADLVTIETTVASGLESIAVAECREVFGVTTEIFSERGHVYFNTSRNVLHKVFSMRSIDHVFLIFYAKNCNFKGDKAQDFSEMLESYAHIKWKKPLSIWKEVYQYTGNLYPTKEEYEVNKLLYDTVYSCKVNKCKLRMENLELGEENSDDTYTIPSANHEVQRTEKMIAKDDSQCDGLKNHESETISVNETIQDKVTIPRFRVSAKRVGSHSFTSEDVAKEYGSLIQEDFLWIVDLTGHDIEVVVNVTNDEFLVGISLTKCSLHRRNLTAFGITSLRATICYGLMKLASPKPGDIVVDPLCGSGSISVEGAAAFPESVFLAGDIDEKACSLSKQNVDSFLSNRKLPIDVLKWDAVRLSFRDASVDVIATDLPFGKRSGSKRSNCVLYPQWLKEMARVLRKGSGRAVLLTADRRNLERSYHQQKQWWNMADRRTVNVGGMKAVVLLLHRTLAHI